MPTQINRCSYSPNTNGTLTQLSTEQTQQAQVDSLIGKIVTQHLGYRGDDEYTIDIKRGEIRFNLVGNEAETRTLRLEGREWKLTQDSNETTVQDSTQQISSDIATVLERVRTAANTPLSRESSQSTTPADSPPTSPITFDSDHSTHTPDFNPHVADLTQIIKSQQEFLQNQIETLQEQDQESRERIRELEENVCELDKENAALQTQNTLLKEQQETLNRLTALRTQAEQQDKTFNDQIDIMINNLN